MTAAEDLVITIERVGGFLELDGDSLKCQLPDSLAHLLPRLKENKAELVALVRRRGGRIAHFPMCPKCGAYALHRKDNLGPYECTACKLQGIEEPMPANAGAREARQRQEARA